MSSEQRTWLAPRLIAGIAVIALGLLLLTDRFDLLDRVSIGELWPAIVLAVGLSLLSGAREPRQRRQGLLLIFLSLWFFVNTLELGGLDWGTSWPLVLVAVGGARLLASRAGRGRAWGALLVLVGLWLQVAVAGLWGLDLESSWPVALVAVGLWLVWTAFGGGSARAAGEESDETS